MSKRYDPRKKKYVDDGFPGSPLTDPLSPLNPLSPLYPTFDAPSYDPGPSSTPDFGGGGGDFGGGGSSGDY